MVLVGSRRRAFSLGWTKGHSVQLWKYGLKHGRTLNENNRNSSEAYTLFLMSNIGGSIG